MKREELKPLVLEALMATGGSATIAGVCKYVWDNYEAALKGSGKYFYVWQYELRWASDMLVKDNLITKGPPRGIWRLR